MGSCALVDIWGFCSTTKNQKVDLLQLLAHLLGGIIRKGFFFGQCARRLFRTRGMGASQSAEVQFEPVAPSPAEESPPSGPRVARNYFLLHPLRTETSFPPTDALTRRQSPASTPHGSPSPAPRPGIRPPSPPTSPNERPHSSRHRGLFSARLAPSKIDTPVVTTSSTEQMVRAPTDSSQQNGCHADVSSQGTGEKAAVHWSSAATVRQAGLMEREVNRAATRVAEREAANEAARAASREAEGQPRWGERQVPVLVDREKDIAEEKEILARAKLPLPAALPQPDAASMLHDAAPLLKFQEAGSSDAAGPDDTTSAGCCSACSGCCGLCAHCESLRSSPACAVASSVSHVLMSRVVPLVIAISIPIAIGSLASAAAYSTMTIYFASGLSAFGVLCFLVTPLSSGDKVRLHPSPSLLMLLLLL